MFEFAVPKEHHIAPARDPADLFPLSLGIVGDLAAGIAREGDAASLLAEGKQNLRFAACFLDAYLNGHSDGHSQTYITLLASAAYYLCDLPGSATVLSNRLNSGPTDQFCRGLDAALIWLLQGRIDHLPEINDTCYADFVSRSTRRLRTFYQEGHDEESILSPLRGLRAKAYKVGSARELLLADLIYAVAKRRIDISMDMHLTQVALGRGRRFEAAAKASIWPSAVLPAQNDFDLIRNFAARSGRYRGVT